VINDEPGMRWQRDSWFMQFWPNCPLAVLRLVELASQLATRDPAPDATDYIVSLIAADPGYEALPLRIQKRTHQAVGRAVRVTRNYQSVRRLPTDRKPHLSYTWQEPAPVAP
jgi:hypothetical protein